MSTDKTSRHGWDFSRSEQPQRSVLDLCRFLFVFNDPEPAYFQHIHLRYPIIDPKADVHSNFEDDEAWATKSVPHQSIFCLLVAIGALSNRDFPGGIKFALDLAHHYQQRSWSVVSQILACPYADSVRILILHVRLSRQDSLYRR